MSQNHFQFQKVTRSIIKILLYRTCSIPIFCIAELSTIAIDLNDRSRNLKVPKENSHVNAHKLFREAAKNVRSETLKVEFWLEGGNLEGDKYFQFYGICTFFGSFFVKPSLRDNFSTSAMTLDPINGCFCLLFFSKFVPIEDQGILVFVETTDFEIHFAHKFLSK